MKASVKEFFTVNMQACSFTKIEVFHRFEYFSLIFFINEPWKLHFGFVNKAVWEHLLNIYTALFDPVNGDCLKLRSDN